MKTLKELFRPLLSRILSPRTIQVARYQWWCLSSFLPRLVTSRLLKRSPQVRTFGVQASASDLGCQLRTVNALAPTKTCRVMSKHGSDKGRMHNYTTVYSALFTEMSDRRLVLVELGLGTNNSDVPSNMGVFGAPGASLRGWRELFPHSRVYGADVDSRVLFQEDRIKTFYCDQLDRSSIRNLWTRPGLQEGADIIIEDGLHTLEGNATFLEESLPHLRPGGIYITEDIMWDAVDEWYHRLDNIYSKQFPDCEFAFVILPNGGDLGLNNMLVIRRRANSNSPEVCSPVSQRGESVLP